MARPCNNVVWLEKACSVCKAVKPHTDFYKNPLRPGLKAECIECNKTVKKKYLKSSGHVVTPSNKPVQLAKNCTKCGEFKSHTDFYKSKGRLESLCKDCKNASLSAYHAKNPNARNQFKTKEYVSDANYKKKYGLSLDEARAMLDAQLNLCANRACGKELSFEVKKGDFGRANVDHCHSTGKVRGILCIGCNTALGHLEQKNKVLGLVEYLKKHGNTNLSFITGACA